MLSKASMTSQGVDPETDESTAHGALTWLAGLTLSVSYGLGAALLAADRDFGLAVASLVFLVISRWFLFVPSSLHRRGRPRRMFLHALVVAIGSFVAVKLGFGKAIWHEFEDRYAATEQVSREASPLRMTGDVLFVLPDDVLRFGSAEASFGQEGAILAPLFPIDLAYERLQFPLASISACGDVEMHPGYTRLRLAGDRVEIGVSDPEQKILAWCHEHGKP